MAELTREQLDKVDHLHNISWDILSVCLGYRPEWNIEAVGKIADAIADVCSEIYGIDREDIYPSYFDEDDDNITLDIL